MSQWTTRIKDHGIWKTLRDLGEEIDKAERRDQIPPDAFDGLERLRSVLTFLGKKLASIDPTHAAPGPLDGMAPRLQTALENVTAFTSDGDPSRIMAANNHADSAMAILATLPGPETPDDLTALSESAASYRTALEQYTNKFVSSAIANQSSLDALAARVGELDKRIGAEAERLTKVIADQQAEFAAAQAERGKAFNDVESARKQAFDKATTENKDAFKVEQKRLAEAVDKLAAEYTEQLAAHKTHLAEESAKAADLHKTELESLRG